MGGISKRKAIGHLKASGREMSLFDRNDKNGRNYDVAKGNVNRCTCSVFGFLATGNLLF
jgi:hypothetical protein